MDQFSCYNILKLSWECSPFSVNHNDSHRLTAQAQHDTENEGQEPQHITATVCLSASITKNMGYGTQSETAKVYRQTAKLLVWIAAQGEFRKGLYC